MFFFGLNLFQEKARENLQSTVYAYHPPTQEAAVRPDETPDLKVSV